MTYAWENDTSPTHDEVRRTHVDRARAHARNGDVLPGRVGRAVASGFIESRRRQEADRRRGWRLRVTDHWLDDDDPTVASLEVLRHLAPAEALDLAAELEGMLDRVDEEGPDADAGLRLVDDRVVVRPSHRPVSLYRGQARRLVGALRVAAERLTREAA